MKSKTRIRIGVLVAGLTSAFLLVMSPPAAEAGIPCEITLSGWCGSIKHYSPDDGLDSDIPIRCKYGDPASTRYVAEGESSTKYCPDADQVYVGSGEEIWCKYPAGPNYDPYAYFTWIKKFDAIGWHKIDDIWEDGVGCTKRVD